MSVFLYEHYVFALTKRLLVNLILQIYIIELLVEAMAK